MPYRLSKIGAERENLDLRRYRPHFLLRAFSLILNGLGRIRGDPFEIAIGVDSEKRRRRSTFVKEPGGAPYIFLRLVQELSTLEPQRCICTVSEQLSSLGTPWARPLNPEEESGSSAEKGRAVGGITC